MKSAALRAQLEQALAGRCSAPFDFRQHGPAETVAIGMAEIDALTGGLPRGALTEIVGPASSGRTSLMLAALAEVTARDEACALVDAQDTFDPHSAAFAGVRLERLLWVRCANLEQTFKATELLLAGGGFGLVAMDLGNVPPRMTSRVPLACWFRFRRAIEKTPTVLVVLEPTPYARTCASLVLHVRPEEVYWSGAGVRESAGKLESRKAKCETRPGNILRDQADLPQPDLPKRDSRISSFKVRTTDWVSHACLLRGARLKAEVARSRGFETRSVRFETGNPKFIES